MGIPSRSFENTSGNVSRLVGNFEKMAATATVMPKGKWNSKDITVQQPKNSEIRNNLSLSSNKAMFEGMLDELLSNVDDLGRKSLTPLSDKEPSAALSSAQKQPSQFNELSRTSLSSPLRMVEEAPLTKLLTPLTITESTTAAKTQEAAIDAGLIPKREESESKNFPLAKMSALEVQLKTMDEGEFLIRVKGDNESKDGGAIQLCYNYDYETENFEKLDISVEVGSDNPYTACPADGSPISGSTLEELVGKLILLDEFKDLKTNLMTDHEDSVSESTLFKNQPQDVVKQKSAPPLSFFQQSLAAEKKGTEWLLKQKFIHDAHAEGDLRGIQKLNQSNGLISQIQNVQQFISESTQLAKAELADVDSPFISGLKDTISSGGSVDLFKGGTGGTYLVKGASGERLFIIKPYDEGPLALNNPRSKATPWNDREKGHIINPNFSLYGSVYAEKTAYEMAEMLGLEGTLPECRLGIIENENFSLITDGMNLDDKENKDVASELNLLTKEKLCSVQTFVSNATDLKSKLEEWKTEGLSDDSIRSKIDEKSYEQANLMVWLTYDNDGNYENFLLTPSADDPQKLSFQKIDNALTFPESNSFFKNQLEYLPSRTNVLSDEGKAKIASIPVDQIVQKMAENKQSVKSIEAFKERVGLLQDIAKKEGVTVEEVNLRMELLGSKIPKGMHPPITNVEFAKKLTFAEVKEINTPTNPFGATTWNVEDARIANLGKFRLSHAIHARRNDLVKLSSLYKEKVEQEKIIHKDLASVLEGDIAPSSGGMGGAYFVRDASGALKGVLKPLDEDFGCVNNRKNEASPFNETSMKTRIKRDIPLYRTSISEALSFRIAEQLNIGDITPETMMIEVTSDKFHDVVDHLGASDKAELIKLTGDKSSTKLCSLQKAVDRPGIQELADVIGDIEKEKGDVYKFLEDKISQSDYEKLNLLTWVTYNNDAHFANILTWPKEDGSLGIQMVDNGLTFPDAHSNFRNETANFNQGEKPLSDELKSSIRDIDVDALAKTMSEFKMPESAIGALKERVSLLKDLASKDGMTPVEINIRFSLLGKGAQLAIAQNKGAVDNNYKNPAFESLGLSTLYKLDVELNKVSDNEIRKYLKEHK